MTLDHEDIEAIAEAVAAKLQHRQEISEDAAYLARLINEGRGDEVTAMQRAKLMSARPRRLKK